MPNPPEPGDKDANEVRLPNGKLQSDEIAKADYANTLDDARRLLKLATELNTEIEKGDRFVVSIAVIRKTEDIEKLAKRIRTRLKRF